jgi:hypothetical protein
MRRMIRMLDDCVFQMLARKVAQPQVGFLKPAQN